MAEWARVAATTITKHFEGAEPAILRNRKLTALLQKRGRISFNHSGKDFDWRVVWKRVKLEQYADMQLQDFQRSQKYKVASLDWRGYTIGDAYSKKEMLMNKGKEAIIKIVSEIQKSLQEDVEEQFAEELYVNGYATGNLQRIHGAESIFAGATYLGVGKMFTPAQTYAGLNTALQSYGGTWVGIWPDGFGDVEYDFWAPLIVNYIGIPGTSGGITYPGFGGNSWLTNCVESLRYGIAAASRNSSQQGVLDVIFLDRGMYTDFLTTYGEKERIMVMRGEKESDLVALGFKEVVNFDGKDVTWEYGIPQNTASTNDTRVGYGWNIDKMEIRSLQNKLFVPEGPEPNMRQRAHLIAIDFFGNMAFASPRYFLKLMAN